MVKPGDTRAPGTLSFITRIKLMTSSGAPKMAESGEEVDVLVQRVVKDITNAFKRNPNM